MLDIKLLRKNKDAIKDILSKRGSWATEGLDNLIYLDGIKRSTITGLEQRQETQNRCAEIVAKLKSLGKDPSATIMESKNTKKHIEKIKKELEKIEEEIQDAIFSIPNIPHESVPDGNDAAANAVVREWGRPPAFEFTPKNHVELGEALDILDLKRAAKIAGARFAVFKGDGALLLRALIQFMLDVQTRENAYTEVYPPVLVNRDALLGTGQLPKFEEDLFALRDDPFYLIPTAEVPVTNLHRDEILDEALLPIRYAAYTVCFRREAGSYGKDTQGIMRQHQFDKVELVKFAHPQTSWDELESLVKDAESILQKLDLPYRVVNLCAGDLGFSAAKTYDLEVWLPGQATYREISSCSHFTDYQARRAKIRYRPKGGGKPELVHTLNGSGLAAGRLWIAVVENHQQADGSIRVPEALRPYLGGTARIAKTA